MLLFAFAPTLETSLGSILPRRPLAAAAKAATPTPTSRAASSSSNSPNGVDILPARRLPPPRSRLCALLFPLPPSPDVPTTALAAAPAAALAAHTLAALAAPPTSGTPHPTPSINPRRCVVHAIAANVALELTIARTARSPRARASSGVMRPHGASVCRWARFK